MKTKFNNSKGLIRRLLAALLYGIALQDAAAQLCSDPANVIYGFTNVGGIHPITVSTGVTGARINPAFTGNPASYSNALGYNPLNGRCYFFKRNSYAPPQEFMQFDPATNLNTMLAASPAPSTTVINLGCVTANGLGYYCLDAFGVLYYYSIASNTWITICSNIRDQFGTMLFSIIDPAGLQRYYGDLSIDGLGRMWIIISGASDYGLYRVNSPPTTAVASLTITQILPPTTPAPMGSFGGMAFNSTGQMLLGTNPPDNRLFRLNSDYTLSFVSNLSLNGVGNDLTSCNFPVSVLPASWVDFSATLKNENNVLLSWSITESANTNGYTVEHSLDGNDWKQIAYVQKIGNDLAKIYTFTMNELMNGNNYYRIRQTSISGTVSYSTIRKIVITSKPMISIGPNPAKETLNVQIGNTGSWLFIHDWVGRLLTKTILKTGMNSINIQNMPVGTYIVCVKSSDGNITNQKIVKQ